MSHLDELVDTLLWEGHQLYPYTPSATKNATPTPFGIVYPPAYAQGSPTTFDRVKLQCVATGTDEFSATVHFIHDGEAHRVEAPADVRLRRRPRPGGAGHRGLRRARPRHGRRREPTEVAEGLDRTAALGFSLLSTHVVVRCGSGGRFESPIVAARGGARPP